MPQLLTLRASAHGRFALALAGLCVLAAGCGSSGDHDSHTSGAPTGPPLVVEPALPGLLLSPAEVDTAVGASDLAVTGDANDMSDSGASVSRQECLAILRPGQARAYLNSGWSAFRSQQLSDPQRSRWVAQSVVLFPTAEQAAVFFTASSTNWRRCDGSFVNTLSGGRENYDVGPIAETNGVLSTTIRVHLEVYDNPSAGHDATNQRVLRVRNNVVIDVGAGGAPDDAGAAKVAEQIAAKVPNG
jgi:hypothetical protein